MRATSKAKSARPLARVSPPAAPRATRSRRSPSDLRQLEALIDALPVAAFVVREPATVLYANALGRSILSTGALNVLDKLRAARHGLDETLLVLPRLPAPVEGEPAPIVAVVRARHLNLQARLAAAAATWMLTPRQTEVLRYLILGEANKTIASRLRCSPATVEIHVSNVLRAAGCDSRAAVMAKFWMQ